MLRRMLYTKIDNYEGFIDTGGGATFKFREGYLKMKFIEAKELNFLPKKCFYLTLAQLSPKIKKNSTISFLDGAVFDKLKNKLFTFDYHSFLYSSHTIF